MILKSIDWHRNGVSGHGFYVAIIIDDEGNEMLVIRNKDADGPTGLINCFALEMKKLDKREIGFLNNSWRGDYYSSAMDEAIDYYEKIGFNRIDKNLPYDLTSKCVKSYP